MDDGVDSAENTTQAFGAAYIGLHNFGIQISQHKTPHGTPDHQPRGHATLSELPGHLYADEPGGTGDENSFHGQSSCNESFSSRCIRFRATRHTIPYPAAQTGTVKIN
jgi:hypothetical protein